MAKVSLDKLGEAIERELTIYHDSVVEKLNTASKEAVNKLVKKTRATAPVGARGSYKRSIAGKRSKQHKYGDTYAWYVKSPDHRLTHLLVHGHTTRDGGRTKADPFLHNAVAEVLPEYEKTVEEVLQG